MSWTDGTPTAMDLYYDPVVDEHVGRGPVGVVAPSWYLAPQRREVAEAGWLLAATFAGALGDGEISGLDDPFMASMLVQLAGEFADPATKARIWDAAEEHVEPNWSEDTGELTLGFGLGEAHPRGQLNARAMAGWVCERGAWSALFDRPNLAKFDQPTVVDVDFPRVALSEASWDGTALRLAAHPQNASVADTRTTVRVTNLPEAEGWAMTRPDGEAVPLVADGTQLCVDVTVDDRAVSIHPA